ncbi:MAG: response regulator [Bdellovibrionales bacterium CG10_big_fil_rev_8_21_14_0_10_45_34]|nr:MAG: response regulator [Bdellovibrionales bacterium CG10_big_fil_rev_8_21_14_0_10_45_34]
MFPVESKILIVDDAQTILAQMRIYLSESGYKNVISAKNLRGAIENFEKADAESAYFQLVLCDINMPGGSGIDFLKFIRKHPKHRETPFIMFTAEAEKSVITEAIAAGVDGYMLKPFSKAQLLQKMADAWKSVEKKKTA